MVVGCFFRWRRIFTAVIISTDGAEIVQINAKSSYLNEWTTILKHVPAHTHTHARTHTHSHALVLPPSHSLISPFALLHIFLWSKVPDSAPSVQSVLKLLKTPPMTTKSTTTLATATTLKKRSTKSTVKALKTHPEVRISTV